MSPKLENGQRRHFKSVTKTTKVKTDEHGAIIYNNLFGIII
jgi:hypothetical protein